MAGVKMFYLMAAKIRQDIDIISTIIKKISPCPARLSAESANLLKFFREADCHILVNRFVILCQFFHRVSNSRIFKPLLPNVEKTERTMEGKR